MHTVATVRRLSAALTAVIVLPLLCTQPAWAFYPEGFEQDAPMADISDKRLADIATQLNCRDAHRQPNEALGCDLLTEFIAAGSPSTPSLFATAEADAPGTGDSNGAGEGARRTWIGVAVRLGETTGRETPQPSPRLHLLVIGENTTPGWSPKYRTLNVRPTQPAEIALVDWSCAKLLRGHLDRQEPAVQFAMQQVQLLTGGYPARQTLGVSALLDGMDTWVRRQGSTLLIVGRTQIDGKAQVSLARIDVKHVLSVK